MELLATAYKQQNMAGPMRLAILFLLLLVPAFGQLNVFQEKLCGDIRCKANQYCSEADHLCKECNVVCDTSGKYFEETRCERECQDYLHDQRYIRNELTGKVQRLEALATSALVIALIFAIILIGIIAIWVQKKNILPSLCFKKNKKAEKGRYPGDTPISTIRLPKSTTVTIPAISEAVRNNNPGPPPTEYSTNLTTFRNPAPKKPELNKQTTTVKPKPQLERRVPSEDSALDFAYDNPAMTPSPVLEKGSPTP